MFFNLFYLLWIILVSNLRTLPSSRAPIISPICFLKVLWIHIYTEVHDPLWVNFCRVWDLGILLMFFNFVCESSISWASFVEKAVFDPLNYFAHLYKISWMCEGESESGFYVWFHWSMCLLLCKYQTILINKSWNWVNYFLPLSSSFT